LIAAIGGATVAWPLTARAQQPTMPVVGYLGPGALESARPFRAAFLDGLVETGYVEGRNVAIEYRWAEDQYDRLPELAGELVRRQVAVIVCQYSSQQESNWPSISRPRRHSVSQFRRRSSRAPTR
jgi:putative ABC transport system substrate-binding protein